MTNGSERIAEYPGRRTGPGTGFTAGNRFVDEAHPGQVFVIGRTVTALGNVDVYDTEGRYHLITRCTIVGGPVEDPWAGFTGESPEEHAYAEGWKDGRAARRTDPNAETVVARAWREHPDSMARAHTELQVDALRAQLAAAEAVIEKVTTTLNTPLDQSKVRDTPEGRALWQAVLATDARVALIAYRANREYRSEGGDRG